MALYIDGSTDASKLDDYEEGTWTPAFKVGGSTANSYSQRQGKYTKIGDIVHFKVRVNASGLASASNPTEIRVVGFPFTLSSDFGSVSFEGGGLVYVFAGLASSGYGTMSWTIDDSDGSAGEIRLWKIFLASTAASYNVGFLNRGDVTNALDIRIEGSVHVS